MGDPLSPYLFILAIEPLAMDIKSNNNIKGVCKVNYQLHMTQIKNFKTQACQFHIALK